MPTCLQVAHFLEALLTPSVGRFWAAPLCDSGVDDALPPAVQEALSATSADVAAAVLQGHPFVTSRHLSFAGKLSRLPAELHPAVCNAAAQANEGAVSLALAISSGHDRLQALEAALSSARDVRALSLVLSGCVWASSVREELRALPMTQELRLGRSVG
jgi:hypothetical protein